ncbi:hypothetical protein BRC62_07360 [Halobacteriales archaeon QH_10_67_13]|nr:MAG: hypothetical protein BRC62_07360 [Halobacteriales archaeon QH_10_67_13]
MLADAAMILAGLGATLATGVGTWVGFDVSAGFHVVLLGVLSLSLPRRPALALLSRTDGELPSSSRSYAPPNSRNRP